MIREFSNTSFYAKENADNIEVIPHNIEELVKRR